MQQATPARRSRAFGIIALVLVNTFWGLSFIASKYALTAGFPPMTLAAARYLFAVLLLVPLSLAKERSLGLKRADIPAAFLSALVGITLYYYFEYTGMMYTSASTASLILATVPVLLLLYGVLFLRERAGAVQWISVALSLLGVYAVIRFGAGGSAGFNGSVKGNLLILGCCVSWVLYIQVNSRLRGKYSSLRITSWQALVGFITLIPFALSERAEWKPVDPLAWGCVIALALICSALCYFLYAEALSSVDPFTVSLFININPIAAVLGGMLLLGERLAPLQWAGGALILLSLLLNNRHAPQAQTKGTPTAESKAGEGEA